MSEFQLKTPVAFIIFNRPDTTARVFAEIAKARPPKLLVVGDGARANRAGETDKVATTRAIIERVDWPCEVLTNFSEVNLGCKVRVSSGLDWVFEQVPEAIILEDDCLPHPTFFRFCEEMLEHYRDDLRIGMISGDNFQFGKITNDDSYYFSKYNFIWGWASWRNRWKDHYDIGIKRWPKMQEEDRIKDWFDIAVERNYWNNIFDQIYANKIDTWDYQWYFSSLVNNRLTIVPNSNLISNIGFGLDATHTTSGSPLDNLTMEQISFPVKHPIGIFATKIFDSYVFNQYLKPNYFDVLKYHIYLIALFLKRQYRKMIFSK
jgi:hypothetical protein